MLMADLVSSPRFSRGSLLLLLDTKSRLISDGETVSREEVYRWTLRKRERERERCEYVLLGEVYPENRTS